MDLIPNQYIKWYKVKHLLAHKFLQMFASASVKPNPEYMKIWKFIFNMYRLLTCNLNYWKNFFFCIPASLHGAGMCLSRAGSLKLLFRVLTVLTSVSAATGAPSAPIVTVVVVMMELSL